MQVWRCRDDFKMILFRYWFDSAIASKMNELKHGNLNDSKYGQITHVGLQYSGSCSVSSHQLSNCMSKDGYPDTISQFETAMEEWAHILIFFEWELVQSII